MTAVQFSRQEVVDILRRAGLREAMRALPDLVDLDHVEEWSARHGITGDDLISRMGGSP